MKKNTSVILLSLLIINSSMQAGKKTAPKVSTPATTAQPAVAPEATPVPTAKQPERTRTPDQKSGELSEAEQNAPAASDLDDALATSNSERNFLTEPSSSQSATKALAIKYVGAMTTTAEFKQPTTPRLSADEIRAFDEMQQTALRFQQEQNVQQKTLLETRREGWDTTADDEPSSTKPAPEPVGWFAAFTRIPQQWWDEHVTDKNRVEQFMRFAGIVPTYIILRKKLQDGLFESFITDLNRNAGEGNRWIDEALQQATEDEQESTTRAIMEAARPYKQALPPATRSQVAKFLTRRTEHKRAALIAEQEDFAIDIQDITRIIREAEEDKPIHPDTSDDALRECAEQAALSLLQRASNGYLPRPQPAITDRK